MQWSSDNGISDARLSTQHDLEHGVQEAIDTAAYTSRSCMPIQMARMHQGQNCNGSVARSFHPTSIAWVSKVLKTAATYYMVCGVSPLCSKGVVELAAALPAISAVLPVSETGIKATAASVDASWDQSRALLVLNLRRLLWEE